MSITDTEILKVVSAEQVGPLRLRIGFGDGATRVVDFERFLTGSRNPLIRGFLEPARFSAFAVRDGTWSGATTS